MSGATMAGTVENVSGAVEPPPIASLVPILQLVLAGVSFVFRLGISSLLVIVHPLRIIWSIMLALFSPITTVVDIILDIALFTPFSVIRKVSVALYPVYVFCAAACIVGATLGIFGHYISTALLKVLARSKFLARPPSPPPAAPLSGSQATLRKRKQRSVRLQ